MKLSLYRVRKKGNRSSELRVLCLEGGHVASGRGGRFPLVASVFPTKPTHLKRELGISPHRLNLWVVTDLARASGELTARLVPRHVGAGRVSRALLLVAFVTPAEPAREDLIAFGAVPAG